MKPAHLVLVAAALLLGLGLWTGRKTSSVAYKDPLDTNEYPLRFTDSVRVPTNSASIETPPPQPPRPLGMSALREPWQTNALNEAIRWLLAEGFTNYSANPFTGVVSYHSHQLPAGFSPSVPGFRFLALPWPERGTGRKANEVNLRVVMGAWTDTGGKTIPIAQGFLGEQVAFFHSALIGNVGVSTVDLNATFGVFKTTNGYLTKNLGWFDP